MPQPPTVGRRIAPAAQPSLVDRVVKSIISEVESGRLPANARLIQDDLARAYGVSRQPVQQALLLLKTWGVVRDSPSRGFAVSVLDPDHVQHLYDIRAALDGLAGRMAARAHSSHARQEGQVIVAKARTAIANRSLPDQIAADVAFHAYISKLSGNPLIAETTAPHWPYVRRVMAEVLRADELLPTTIWNEHAAILEAVAEGDEEAAEALSRRHVLGASAILVGRLRERRSVGNDERRIRRDAPLPPGDGQG